MDHFKELLSFSNMLGRDVFLVQGPGGNTSYKDKSKNEMWVKGSGTELAKVEKKDFSIVEVDQLRGQVLSLIEESFTRRELSKEADYVEIVSNSRKSSDQIRPSMEAGLHAILPYSWVIHFHSLRFQIAREVLDLDKILSSKVKLFYVDDCLPGFELCKKISELDIKNHEVGCIVIRRHGVVWFSNSISKIQRLIKITEDLLEELLELNTRENYLINGNVFDYSAWSDFYFHDEPLFPDYAIFSNRLRAQVNGSRVTINKEICLTSMPWVSDLVHSHAIISTVLKNKSKDTTKLTYSKYKEVLELEAEKKRLKEMKSF